MLLLQVLGSPQRIHPDSEIDRAVSAPDVVIRGAGQQRTVKNQIRNGSADMAAYKYTLTEADIDDLVSFLRQECC